VNGNFADLTDAELQAFELICVGDDKGHRSTVVASLVEKGLIVRQWEDHGQVVATGGEHYGVPLPTHAQYCRWCSENFTEDGRRNQPLTEPTVPRLDPRAAIGPLPGLEGA